MTFCAEDFIRLFLQHALPPGFQRIRYYGFLADCHRARKPELRRHFLQLLPSKGLHLFPRCGVGVVTGVPLLPPRRMDNS